VRVRGFVDYLLVVEELMWLGHLLFLLPTHFEGCPPPFAISSHFVRCVVSVKTSEGCPPPFAILPSSLLYLKVLEGFVL